MKFTLTKYFFLLFVGVLGASCDRTAVPDPGQEQEFTLLSEAASGLPKSVYQAITKDDQTSVAAKNEIMRAVKDAIEKHPANEAARNSAIERAVLKHSKNVQWANNIKAAVPLRPDVLLTFAKSGLVHNSVYLVISNHPSATVAQKNNIMKAVKAAMENPAKNQKKRDKSIDDAVLANGNHANWATQIKDAVNLADPLVVMSEAESGLAHSIYEIIRKHGTATVLQKNNLMRAVKAAIDNPDRKQKTRDQLIDDAVMAQGNHPNLATQIKAAVDLSDPLMMSETEAALPHDIYQLIHDHPQATILEKNALLRAVKTAMDDPAKNQKLRAKAIDDAVLAHGNYANLATQIKTAVDTAEPLLVSEADTGLVHEVYDVIAQDKGTSIPHKNLIFAAVKAAMDKPVKNQTIRDKDIDDAVGSHGNAVGLAEKIKNAVDIADPIPAILFTQPESGLKQSIYDVIVASLASNLEKNRIMTAVKLAIDALPADQNVRDLAIEKVVNKNGAYANLAKNIKNAVDIEHPIANDALLQELCFAFDEGQGGKAKIVINKGAPVNGKCGAKTVFEKMVSSVNAPELREELLILMLQKGLTLSNTYPTLNADGLGEIRNATVLSYAIRENFGNAVKELGLLLSDAQIQAVNHQGLNPLHYGAFFNSYKSLEALAAEYLKRAISLDLVVGPGIPTLEGKTALEVAEYNLGFPTKRFTKETIDVLKKAKSPQVLLTLAESELPEIVYNAIKDNAMASILERNSIMRAVKAALDKPADIVQRDKDIVDAVNANGGYVGFAQTITDAVDEARPIGPRLLCRALLANNVAVALEKIARTPLNTMCTDPSEDVFSRMVRTINNASDRGKLLSAMITHSLDLKKVYPVLPTSLAGDLKNQTVFKYAIRENLRLPVVDIMARLKDDELTARTQGLTVLHYAAFLGKDQAVMEIAGEFTRRKKPLNDKADADAAGGNGGLTALEIAQNKGFVTIVDFLNNPVPVIYSRDDIDLDLNLYNVIALSAAPVTEKNAMLRAIKSLLNDHHDHSVRRFFIKEAIVQNPGFAGQYNALRNALDAVSPLDVIPATALKGTVLPNVGDPDDFNSGEIDPTTKLPKYIFIEMASNNPWIRNIVIMHPDQYRGYKPTYGDTIYFEALTAKPRPTPKGERLYARVVLGVR